MAITEELLELSFNSWIDNTLRHTLYVNNVTLSDNSVASSRSALFNNSSYIQIIDNQEDWLLGSTINNNLMSSKNWGPTNSDNEFTFDCWIYPINSGSQYYPIISSFKDVWFNNITLNLGWSLQLDTFSGKLQLISYLFGDCTNRIIESYGTVNLNQWNHVALMSWKNNEYSSKYFFINGVADGGYSAGVQGNISFANQTKFFPISNILTHEAYNGTSGSPDYSPLYIGMGPRSLLTNPQLNSSFYFKRDSGVSFIGYIGKLRIGLGTRYSISGSSIDPFLNVSTTTITTTTITTTTSTTTSTTQGERGEIPIILDNYDLLALKLRNDVVDLTNRHYIRPIGNLSFSLTELGCNSISFNGTNYLLAMLNSQDFSLGSTLLINDYNTNLPVCKNDNQFSLEFWINPARSENRYVGICGSFSKNFAPVDVGDTNLFENITKRRDYNIGWSILLDTEDEKLIIVNFSFNQVKSITFSNLLVPINQWTHVAFMSTMIGNAPGMKFLFINGNPDIVSPFNSSKLAMTNGVNRGSVLSNIDSYAPLFIGMAANIYIEDKSNMLNYNFGNKFIGHLSTFRLSSAARFPTDGTGFIPYQIPDTISITSGTTQTSTTGSTDSTTITSQFPGYLKITGILSSNEISDSTNWTQILCQ